VEEPRWLYCQISTYSFQLLLSLSFWRTGGGVSDVQLFTSERAYSLRSPDLSDLTLEELAFSLSRIYRWRGSSPISVAQHSVAMTRQASTRRGARFCLLHDAAEALIGDLPSPLKQMASFERFSTAEDRILAAVHARFGLAGPAAREVRRLDLQALRKEAELYVPHAVPVLDPTIKPLAGSDLDEAWSSARARREFLLEAERLGLR
jgi:hypothetical protein